jgi:hypothetical protein
MAVARQWALRYTLHCMTPAVACSTQILPGKHTHLKQDHASAYMPELCCHGVGRRLCPGPRPGLTGAVAGLPLPSRLPAASHGLSCIEFKFVAASLPVCASSSQLSGETLAALMELQAWLGC